MIQALFMHHLSGGLLSAIVAYVLLLSAHQILLPESLNTTKILASILWLSLQLIATVLTQAIVGEIGELFANESVST